MNLPSQTAVDEINAIQAEIDTLQGTMVEKAVSAGEKLTALKEQIDASAPGTWMKWADANINIARASRNRYMQAALKKHLLEDYSRVSNGSLNGFLRFTGEPEPPKPPPPTRDQVLANLAKSAAEAQAKTLAKRERNQSKVEKVFARLPEKAQKALNDYMQDQCDEMRELFNKKFLERTKDYRESIQKERTEISETKARLRKAQALCFLPLDLDEYRLILGLIHPDKHEGDEGAERRANRAVNIFKRLESVCKPKKKKARSAA